MISANFALLGEFSFAVGLADGAPGGRAVAPVLLIKSGNQPLSHCRERVWRLTHTKLVPQCGMCGWLACPI